ncbi:unnamed protein product (macronuclear) [Paramecium tetraurelia]|uniref:Uncharacterized protein n=1 Tax=Paramecium tetraurelia TaxID=5888 RepID=A0DEK4_PARTE|nr:uncharacterized protein GSPATT00016297001 [Paramecium tetraurelia]CAK81471.1 unnamed protein product [Paramecium tetraurelia]|eukprot:XP_001448868.1 hypothetical protein (macronuclear) [Paramecium tetraurelia strain d4-2]
MNFNRQELLNLQNRIFNRPRRLNSVYVAPTLDDIGILAELPNNKVSNLGFKQQSALRTQLKKYRNLFLYDKKLFRNRRESRDFKENAENKGSIHHINSSKQSSLPLWEDDMKITKLSIMKSEILRSKIPDIPKHINNSQSNCPRRLSHINPEPIQFKNLVVLPSIRGWDNNNQNSQRSN